MGWGYPADAIGTPEGYYGVGGTSWPYRDPKGLPWGGGTPLMLWGPQRAAMGWGYPNDAIGIPDGCYGMRVPPGPIGTPEGCYGAGKAP